MGEKKDEMLCIRVTVEEKNRLKSLASEERKTLKGLIFSALDKVFTNWDKDKKE